MDPTVIPVMGMLIPIVVVPTALAFRHARRVKDQQHAERMRALELGRNWSDEQTWWQPARLCAGITMGVPLGCLALAWFAAESSGWRHEEVWIFSGMIGLASVISGSMLTRQHLAARERSLQHAASIESARLAGKEPMYDPDLYDVVGRRG